MEPDELADAIRAARRRADLTQQQLAEWLGVSLATVKRMESGIEATLGRSEAARRGLAAQVAGVTGQAEVFGIGREDLPFDWWRQTGGDDLAVVDPEVRVERVEAGSRMAGVEIAQLYAEVERLERTLSQFQGFAQERWGRMYELAAANGRKLDALLERLAAIEQRLGPQEPPARS